MHFHVDAVAAAKVFQHSLLALDRIDVLLLAPLERRVRLWHEVGGRTGRLNVLVVFVLAKLAYFFTKLGDADHVVIRFGRQPDHEIHLHCRPAFLKRN